MWFSLLLLVLLGPFFVLLFLDSAIRAWLLAARCFGARAQEPGGAEPVLSTAALIPAHDESGLIGDTVARLRARASSPAVFVIADNCTDDTAAVARQAGAEVWERHEPASRGKGAALRWFLAAAADRLRDHDTIAVFDADSIVGPGFFSHASTALSQGADTVQGFVHPRSGGSPASDLAAYSELLSQRIDDTARSRLGWPVPLRGTGMVFRREVLQDLMPRLKTKVEDIEMSLLLASQGKSVRFVPAAVIGDPKPRNTQGVATQRARWLQGQMEVLRTHSKLVLRLLLGGRPGHMALVFGSLLKPKTLLLFLKTLWFALALVLPFSILGLRYALATFAGLALFSDLVYYMAGLSKVETPGRYVRALACVPLYPAAWLWSLGLSFVSSAPWLSVRQKR